MVEGEWEERIVSEVRDAQAVLQQLVRNDSIIRRIASWADICATTIAQGGVLFFAGNGGSFADAQHLAAEFTGKMGRRRPPLPAVVLGSNGASVTAIGNDYSYADVFAREFLGLNRENSSVLVFSTSGNSESILRLVDAALQSQTPVMAFTGASGGKLAEMVECIKAPSDRTERIQEVHGLLGHILSGLVEDSLAGRVFHWDEAPP